MEHSGFPSHETLAAFVDGRLDTQTRRRVIEHMADCNECRGLFVTATAIRTDRGESAARTISARSMRRRRAGLLAAILAVTVGIVLSWQLMLRRRPDPLPPGVAHLVAASAKLDARNTEARISGFPYRPVQKTLRGKAPDTDPEQWKRYSELLSAAGDIQEHARDKSPANLHALGISQLLLGHFPEARIDLEKAVQTETGRSGISEAIHASKDAQLLSDLSAATSCRGGAPNMAPCAGRRS